MLATYDSLMGGNEDEPDSVYGLLARSVRYTPDKLTYRFLLRPEARFSDGSPLRAADVVFSLTTLKEKAHPCFFAVVDRSRERRGRGRGRRQGALHQAAHARRASHRRGHADLLGGMVEGAGFRRGHARGAARVRAPIRSKTFEQGRFIEFELDHELLGQESAAQRGRAQFSAAAIRIFPRTSGRLRGLQGRRRQLQRGTHLALLGEQLRFRRRQGGPRRQGDRCTTARLPARRAGISTPAANSSRTRAFAKRSASPSTSSGRTRT